jgi:DNA modification methylase
MAKEDNNIPTGLHWQGKRTEVERISLPFQTIETINESRATREKERDSLLKGLKKKEDPAWYNRLIWGDNKYVMSSLLDELAGKVDLIYIDPPFATGADFSVTIEIGDIGWTKEPSAIEEKAYRDTWGKGIDSYLQMIYDRLVFIRDLLSDTGSLYMHLDYHVGHYVKIAADDIFGKENFLNEIVWQKIRTTKAQSVGFGNVHDTILVYKKASEVFFENQYVDFDPAYIESHYKKDPTTGRLFRTVSLLQKGQGPARRFGDKVLTPPIGMHWIWSQERIDDAFSNGLIRLTSKGRPEKIQFLDEMKGDIVDDIWTDIYPINSQAIEALGYATQKPEALLERIIKSSCPANGLVADFFCGSGTTGAVAEKLGRQWIMADIGRYAIHTTRKRMLGIELCKPFVVQNLGKYERQYWQGVTFAHRKDEQKPIYEYLKFILELYHAEPVTGCLWIHGKIGKTLVHIGAVDAPVTLADIESAIDECKKMKQSSLDILGWEWEMGLHDVIQEIAKAKGVKLSLKYIPREVMDARAIAAGDITFYELAYLEVEVSKNKHGEFVVALKDFVIPNHDMIPDEVRSKIKKWSDYIDYWSIDWDFNNDTFHNMWQSYRTRKDRILEQKSDPHLYEKKGKHLILIKVIDIFGNDTTRLVEVSS